MKKIITLLMMLWMTVGAWATQWPEAKITVHVVDDNGKTVSGANVHIGYEEEGGKNAKQDGITNNRGIFEVTIRTIFRIYVRATKSGYYVSDTHYEFKMGQLNKPEMPDKWEPYNPTIEIVLRPILNPIPMYAARVEAKIPKDADKLGFDLVAGDWVAPYGSGATSDFIFISRRNISGEKQWDVELTLNFANKGDGLLAVLAPFDSGSELRLPNIAPANGYENEWGQKSSSSKYFDAKREQNYFFRVRTITDGKGNVSGGLYGKIYGEIEYYAGVKAPQAGLGFTYYLNPNVGDRNVEFDTKQNLFTLPKNKQIQNP